MAQRFYGIDLQNTTFPFLSEQQGRTVIGAVAGESSAKRNKVGVAYGHNIMPSLYGIDSIGYLNHIPAFTNLPSGVTFSDVRVIYGNVRSRIYLAWDTKGNVYSLLPNSLAWIAIPATVPSTGGVGFSIDTITVGTVDGISYIYYSTIGAFIYNESTNILDSVTLTGLTISDVLGLVASSGYLIAYTENAIAWSSTLLPTDFVPDKVTGAGGGNVAGIAGKIKFIVPNTLGVLVYTEANILAGTYTGNVQYPFKFREVENSKGGISLDEITYEANYKSQFAFSKAGIQSITSRRAETILPEVTDFLAGKKFEDYNEVTKLYEKTNLTSSETMLKKLKYIASRYLIISYGLPSTGFTHAIVFDTSLNKLGKLKIPHVDVFEYVGNQKEIGKEIISFLTATGEVKLVDFSVGNSSNGVLILGKIQFVRTKLTNLLGVEIENVPTGASLSVSSQVSLDGKNFTSVEGTLKNSADNVREYTFRAFAKNHSLVFIGEFNLVTAQVRYAAGSRR